MKKRLVSIFLIAVMMISTLSTVIAEEVTDDYKFDSSTNTYTVYNFTGLQTAIGYINGGNYSYNITLASDIAVTSPICIATNKSTPYSGTIDGNGYILSSLTASADTSNQALIGYSGGATVKDLTVTVSMAAGTGSNIAGFVAQNISGVTFENCSISGTVSGAGVIGGYIGLNSAKASFTNCSSAVNVTSSGASAGGFIGSSSKQATFNDCEVLSSTVGATGNNVGGLIGLSSGTVNASNCTVYGVALTSGGNYVGGILGRMNCKLIECNNVAVNATINANQHVGGIVGGDGYSSSTAADPSTYPKITLTNVVTAGDYTASTSYVGGILGYNVNVAFTLTNAVTFAHLSSANYAGGLASIFRGDVISVSNFVYCGEISCTGANSSQIASYVQITDASQTASFTDCFVWGISDVKLSEKIDITSGITPVITVGGTATEWASAKTSHLSAAGVRSRVKYNMTSFNEDLVNLTEECQKTNTKGERGALAVSEVSPCPSNGIYEFIEIVNTSRSNVSLDGYTVIRSAYVNSGKAERNSIQRLIGISDSLVPSAVNALTVSDTGIVLKPNAVAVIWFASSNGKDKTVDDFRSYWQSQGCDMSNVTVARVVNYNDLGDIHPATKIHSKCGVGFLPDRHAAFAVSLVKPSNANIRLSNGSTLGAANGSAAIPVTKDDVNLIINYSDSYAIHFTQETVNKNYSFNYYDFADEETYRKALAKFLPDIIKEIASTYPFTAVFPTLLTGEPDADGLPPMYSYLNVTDTSIASSPYFAGGTEMTTSSPGKLYSGQFINVHLDSYTVGTNKLTLKGYAPNSAYSELGFAVYTVKGDGTIKNSRVFLPAGSIASNGAFTVTANSFPISKGDIICIDPYVKDGSGKVFTSTQKRITYPERSVSLYNDDASKLRVAYFAEESTDYMGYYEAARLLADDLQYYTGKDVTLVPFDKHAAYRQIVVGSPESAAAYMPSGMSIGTGKYAILGRYGNIFIIGGNALAAEYAVQTVIDAAKATTSVVDLTTLCSNTVKTFDESVNHLPLADGASFRAMTCNVLRYELYQDLTRITNFVNTFKYYQPDVIGFQEYCATFTANLTPKLQSLGYTVLGNEMITTGTQNFTPLAYKTARFNCIAKGWFKLSGESAYPGHNVTWAVLQDKTTGEKFAISTTHFFHLSDRTKADPIRAINAQEIVDLTTRLTSQYDCAVVNMGDYNTYSTDVGYPVFSQTGVLRDCRFITERDLFLLRTSHPTTTSSPASGSMTKALDIFHVNDLVRIARFKVPMNSTTSIMCDHFPSFIDFTAGKPSEFRTTSKNNAEYQVETQNGYSVIKVPENMNEQELLSMFDGNVKLSDGVVSGSKITRYFSTGDAPSVYLIVENDVNGDGFVNAKDIIRAKKIMNGVHTDDLRKAAIDTDENGAISIGEYEALVKKVSE